MAEDVAHVIFTVSGPMKVPLPVSIEGVATVVADALTARRTRRINEKKRLMAVPFRVPERVAPERIEKAPIDR